jgi:hypothetical protein
VRRAAESADSYDGCLLLHSLSGGTGSGLGTRLVEELRERYVSACGAPLYHQRSNMRLGARARGGGGGRVRGAIPWHGARAGSR